MVDIIGENLPSRPITTAEAIAYALDPRNDNGKPDQLHVMAQNYDQDCPNVDDHDFIAHHDDTDTSKCWTEEVCECYDGIVADDVETWMSDDGQRIVDEEGFGEWGPFLLVFDIDPGEPQVPA